MARKPSFSFTKTTSGWKVEIPGRLSPTGDRQRVFFPTRDEAKNFAAELRTKNDEHGAMASVIAPSLADEAQRAVEMLKPYDISLLEAARMAVKSRKSKLSSRSIDGALEDFLKAKTSRSDSHMKAYGYMKRDLLESFPGRMMSSIPSAFLALQFHSSRGCGKRNSLV